MKHARLLSLALLVALVSGCGERPASSEPAARPATAPSEPPSTTVEPAPSAGPDPLPSTPTPADDAPPPPDGCALVDAVPVPHAGGWTDLVATDSGFLVAGLEAGGSREHLALIALEPGSAPHEVARVALDYPTPSMHRAAGPVLERRGAQVGLLLVDAEARLLFALIDPADPRLELRLVAEGASGRFRPALAPTDDGWAVAWTDGRDTPMRVHTRTFDPAGRRPSPSRDLTPLAGGAGAPTVVIGSQPPTLIFLDPRRATSVSLRAGLGEGGFVSPEVARPIGLVTEPPEVVAVRLGDAEWLAYTGIGALATTAVGLVRLSGVDTPQVLVEGTGYGTLHVDADRLGAGAVFVADTPQEPAPGSARSVALRTASPSGALGEFQLLQGPSGTGDRARVASGSGGRVAVTFRDRETTYARTGRCAVPSLRDGDD